MGAHHYLTKDITQIAWVLELAVSSEWKARFGELFAFT
jgi:hypothetical protein